MAGLNVIPGANRVVLAAKTVDRLFRPVEDHRLLADLDLAVADVWMTVETNPVSVSRTWAGRCGSTLSHTIDARPVIAGVLGGLR